MDLSFIIPTHNRSTELVRLLQSIERSSLAAIKYEINVVSNFPDIEVQSVCQQFEKTRYFVSQELGANAARNLGLRVSQGDVVFFLDDDCFIDDPHLFEKHLEIHRQTKDWTGVGGIYRPCQGYTLHGLAHWEGMMNWLVDVLDLTNTYRLIGGHASYKRQNLKGHWFQADIAYGSAEVSFNQRLYEQGRRLALIPELHVMHAFDMQKDEMEYKCRKQAQNYSRLFLDPSLRDLKPLDQTMNPQKRNDFILDVLSKLESQEQFQKIKQERIQVFWQAFRFSSETNPSYNPES
jgi:glycosyltransferase involved in cell wall biosynthesis